MATRIAQDMDSLPEQPTALRPNRRLTALAQALAASARGLLPADDDRILGVARNRHALRILWWDRSFALVDEVTVPLDAFGAPETDAGAVQRDGDALIDYLAGRWPQHAAPAELGVITDGDGVAFAPTRPSPAAPGWLLHHAFGDTALQMILPLDPTGSCALLTRVPTSALVH